MITYHTQDTGLAATLATCGIEFPRNAAGQLHPALQHL